MLPSVVCGGGHNRQDQEVEATARQRGRSYPISSEPVTLPICKVALSGAVRDDDERVILEWLPIASATVRLLSRFFHHLPLDCSTARLLGTFDKRPSARTSADVFRIGTALTSVHPAPRTNSLAPTLGYLPQAAWNSYQNSLVAVGKSSVPSSQRMLL